MCTLFTFFVSVAFFVFPSFFFINEVICRLGVLNKVRPSPLDRMEPPLWACLAPEGATQGDGSRGELLFRVEVIQLFSFLNSFQMCHRPYQASNILSLSSLSLSLPFSLCSQIVESGYQNEETNDQPLKPSATSKRWPWELPPPKAIKGELKLRTVKRWLDIMVLGCRDLK